MALYVDESIWKVKLQDMAHRNTAVDLSPSPDSYNDGKPPVFRVRMLHMDDKAIFLEYPSSTEAVRLFRGGEPVRIMLNMQEMHWEFYGDVVGRVKLRLNASKHIHAMKVTLPDSVKTGQRRDYFRAPTTAMDLKSVVLFPLESRKAGPPTGDLHVRHKQVREAMAQKTVAELAASTEIVPFIGKLLNISGAGIGVAIKGEDAESVALNQWFWVQIELPTSDDPIQAFAIAVRLERQTEHVFHLGMGLEWPDALAAKDSVESIVQFTTHVQRTQLRKRRES